MYKKKKWFIREEKNMTQQVTRSIIVKADVNDVYRVWSNFRNFPNFMKNIIAVAQMDDRTSHWEMQGPLGQKIEWDAETTVMEENKRIAWSSKDREDVDITTSGQVTFNSLPNNETEVTVTVQYVPRKGGKLGEAVGSLFSNPEKQLEEDLNNFKDFIEARPDRTA
jgi:uncharacterized membrane protein